MNSRLLRATGNAKIAGVCSGIARRVGADPVLVRLIFVGWFFLLALGAALILYAPLRTAGLIAFFAGPLSVFSYLILWVSMPSDRAYSSPSLAGGVAAAPEPRALPARSTPAEQWAYDPYTGERISRS